MENPGGVMGGPGGRDWGAPALVALLLIPLYCLPNTVLYNDALADAVDVAYHGWASRIHPHHLGAGTIYWLLWRLVESLGISADPLTVMSAVGRFAMVGVAMQTAILLGSLGCTRRTQVLGGLMLGLSFSAWHFATTGSTYPPAIACVTGAFLILWRAPTLPSARMLWEVSALLLIAVLFHQLAMLMIPSVVLWIWLEARRGGVASPGWTAMRATAILLTPITVAYLLGPAAIAGRLLTPEELWLWGTTYGRVPVHWVWHKGATGLGTLWLDLRMVTMAHGDLVWALPFGELAVAGGGTVRDILERLLPVALCRILVGVLVLGILTAVVGGWRWVRDEGGEYARYRRLALLFAAPIFLFCIPFEPQNSYYRVYYLPLLIGLVAPVIEGAPGPGGRLARLAGGTLLGLTMALNTIYGWLPRAEIANNPLRAPLAEIASFPAGPLAIATGLPARQYLQYFLARPSYRAEWYTADGSPLEGDPLRGIPESLHALWLAGEAVSVQPAGSLEERLVRGESLVEQLGGTVWLHKSVLQNRTAEARLLRLWRPPRRPGIPPEIWLDVSRLEEVARREAGVYRFIGYRVRE